MRQGEYAMYCTSSQLNSSSSISSKSRGRYCVVFCAVFSLLVASAVTSPAQTFTSLFSFDGTTGGYPYYVYLVQGLDGNLYGTTFGGGANSEGTVFKITTAGTLTTLYNFCSQVSCTDGDQVAAGLVLATNGNFYGATTAGGAGGI